MADDPPPGSFHRYLIEFCDLWLYDNVHAALRHTSIARHARHWPPEKSAHAFFECPEQQRGRWASAAGARSLSNALDEPKPDVPNRSSPPEKLSLVSLAVPRSGHEQGLTGNDA